MNKLKKWAFGGAKDSDYHGDTSSYYGHEHDEIGRASGRGRGVW